LWIAAPGQAIPAEIRVIANPSIKSSVLSAAELRGVFLETKTSLADGNRAEPVLLKAGPAHETFVRHFLGKTNTALEAYYRSLVFTGRGLMPASRDTEDEVVAYVARTPGAIGYVSNTASLASVKILEIK
jgi:ABC-type phosphate transport system substrate-binding protein